MQLTLKGDYAVRVVLDLALHREGLVTTRDLGRRTDVPPAFLSKIVQALAHAGLLRTQRGAAGGVALLRAPETISLREVIEAVEGPIRLNRCLVRRGLCPRDRTCPVHPAWVRIQRVFLRELDAVRFDQLAAVTPPGGPATRRQAS